MKLDATAVLIVHAELKAQRRLANVESLAYAIGRYLELAVLERKPSTPRGQTKGESAAAFEMLCELQSLESEHLLYRRDKSDPLAGVNDLVPLVRAVIQSLRSEPERLYDAFAGDGLQWRERTSQSVFARYLDLISPPAPPPLAQRMNEICGELEDGA